MAQTAVSNGPGKTTSLSRSDSGPRVERPIDLRRTVPFRLLGIANKLTQGFLNVYTAEFGIGLPEWRTLGMLGQFGQLPSIRIAELAEMDRGAISRSVAWLEANGLVRRIDDPAHQRRKIVAMTGAGRRLHDRIALLARARQQEALDCLLPTELATLEGILDKLDRWADDLRTRGVRPNPRVDAKKPRRAQEHATASLPPPIRLQREKLLAELASFKRTIETIT